MKEKLLIIANNLNLIYIISKMLHWNASGTNYYGDHLLFDRISENIHDMIDGLTETCIIPLQKNDEVNFNFNKAFEFQEVAPNEKLLLDLIVNTIREADALAKTKEIPEGIKTYLTDISKELLVKAGLLDRRLK